MHEVFKFMKNLYYEESYEQFIDKVDESRAVMLQVASDEIKGKPEKIDIKTIKKLPDGRWDTIFEGINFECFFHYKESERLYVVLNGAITGFGVKIPAFFRWTYYKYMNGSMLNIADPMYRLYDKLMLGWYYGTENINLHQVVGRFVLNIAQILNVKPENICFLGSSGGGFAAIECANWIVGAKSIAFNPQIVLEEWGYHTEFTRITGIDLTKKDRWNRNNAVYCLKESKNMNLLFVNIRSRVDMKQIENICNAMDITVKYGINIFKNMIIWLYDADLTPWESAHSVQENYCIWFLLEWLIEHSREEEKVKQFDELFNLVTEFHYERFRVEKELRNSFPDLKQVVKCIQSRRKIAVWGMGDWFLKLDKELFQMEGDNPYGIGYVIDNDSSKCGTYKGVPIVHPSEIEDWKQYYIIITSKVYSNDIRYQLEDMGLIWQQDFCIYLDLYKTR